MHNARKQGLAKGFLTPLICKFSKKMWLLWLRMAILQICVSLNILAAVCADGGNLLKIENRLLQIRESLFRAKTSIILEICTEWQTRENDSKSKFPKACSKFIFGELALSCCYCTWNALKTEIISVFKVWLFKKYFDNGYFDVQRLRLNI